MRPISIILIPLVLFNDISCSFTFYIYEDNPYSLTEVVDSGVNPPANSLTKLTPAELRDEFFRRPGRMRPRKPASDFLVDSRFKVLKALPVQGPKHNLPEISTPPSIIENIGEPKNRVPDTAPMPGSATENMRVPTAKAVHYTRGHPDTGGMRYNAQQRKSYEYLMRRDAPELHFLDGISAGSDKHHKRGNKPNDVNAMKDAQYNLNVNRPVIPHVPIPNPNYKPMPNPNYNPMPNPIYNPNYNRHHNSNYKYISNTNYNPKPKANPNYNPNYQPAPHTLYDIPAAPINKRCQNYYQRLPMMMNNKVIQVSYDGMIPGSVLEVPRRQRRNLEIDDAAHKVTHFGRIRNKVKRSAFSMSDSRRLYFGGEWQMKGYKGLNTRASVNSDSEERHALRRTTAINVSRFNEMPCCFFVMSGDNIGTQEDMIGSVPSVVVGGGSVGGILGGGGGGINGGGGGINGGSGNTSPISDSLHEYSNDVAEHHHIHNTPNVVPATSEQRFAMNFQKIDAMKAKSKSSLKFSKNIRSYSNYRKM